MGPQYQATIDSYAASPQATQSAGNQTLGKAMEQSPVHDGFGTGSSMYDNDMGKGYQPAPVAQPPQPQNQPSTAGVTPSWAQEQKPLKKGGRAKRADGGGFYATQNAPSDLSMLFNQAPSSMMTGDTLAKMAASGTTPVPGTPAPTNVGGGAKMSLPSYEPDYSRVSIPAPSPNIYSKYRDPNAGAVLYNQGLSNEDFLNQASQAAWGGPLDEAGKNFWLDALNKGYSQKDAENTFYGTKEAKQYEQSKLNDFLDNLYQQEFARSADPGGKQYWAERINKGTPLQEVEKAFIGSPEYQNRAFLDQAYQSALGRNANQAELQNWMGKLASGEANRKQIDQALNASEEVQKNLARGITPDIYGEVDPFVAGYNARVGTAQNIYGTIAKQNYEAAQEQKKQYQAALDALTKTNAQKMTEAEVLKKQQDEAAAAAAAEADRQRLLLFLLMSQG